MSRGRELASHTSELSDSLLVERGVDERNKPLGLYVVEGCDPRADLARQTESAVFAEYFGKSPEDMKRIYQKYENDSFFLLVMDQVEKKPAGALRIIKGPSNMTFDEVSHWGLDAEASFMQEGIELQSAYDIGTIAILPGYRSSDSETGDIVKYALYSGLFRYSIQHPEEVDTWTAILDKNVNEKVLLPVGIHFKNLSDAEYKFYEGSTQSAPQLCRVEDARKGVKDVSSELYSFLAHGVGLDEAVSIPK